LRKVLVTTAENNEPARRLYEKIGFKKSAVLKDLYGKNENELVYILTLNPEETGYFSKSHFGSPIHEKQTFKLNFYE